jgi:TolB-like protein/DNA-binding winged helix-turn-helix (wHTH) protein
MDRSPRRFQLDVAAYRLLRDGRPVRLERQPMELLILLASRPGALVTRQEIAARFWGEHVFVDVEGSINRIIGKLRLALHDDPARPRFIETVVGKGYRLIGALDAPVRSVAVPQQGTAAVSDRNTATQPNSAPPRDEFPEAEFTPRPRGLALDLVTPKSLVGKRSVAVLPFKLLAPSGDDAFLSVALADAIVTHLGASPDLLVRPIAMVQRYAGESTEPIRAARELNVQVVVNGTVQRLGTKLRVCLQAIDIPNGDVLLSAKYDAEMHDLFALQDAVADSVAKALEFEQVGVKESSEGPPTGNRMAYELFLRAADKLSRLNQWDTQAAIDMLEKAVQLDARFAGAWARMAEAHLLMAFTFGEGARAVAAAERAAHRALALDPSNSVAQ